MKKALKTLALMTSAICIVGMASCSVHKRNVLTERPQPEQIQAALDSICAEGYNLFVAERVNWIATDSALAHCDENNLRGNIIWQPNSGMWSAVFFDREQKNCLFELVYDTRTGEERFFYEPRPLSEQEREQWELKGTMFDNAIKSYGDSLRYNSDYGRPNVDFVRVDPNTIRMYILQGVERPNVIPIGNDYSIDFDNKGNTKAFRRYHRSFLPMSTVDENGEKVATIYHSHLKDNPYITPTDICNFLLYRGEMESTGVLSTALDGYIIYNAKDNSAVFLSKEVMEKINGNK